MFLRNSRNMILLTILALCAVGFLMAGDHEEIQTLKLEDLADGETRTFGEGDHKVTVTRKGDQLVVEVEADGMDWSHGKHVMLVEGDDADEDHLLWTVKEGNVVALDSGDAHTKMMFVTAEGDADGKEIEKKVYVIRAGEHDAENITIDVLKEGGEPHVIKMITKGDHGHGDKIVLSCPEGDTTMVIDKENAEETYFCPEHKIEMKPVVHKVIKKEIEVHTKDCDKKKEKDND